MFTKSRHTNTKIKATQKITESDVNLSPHTQQRRALLISGVTAGLAPVWSKPVINSIVIPAHAQTSMCMTDMTVGGPLIGNAFGADNCQAACEFEAHSQGAQLCAVEEITTSNGIDCSCDLDLPE